jgi:hypothetical protein
LVGIFGSARCKAATYTGQHKHRINADISMPWVEFEPMIPVFERAKTVLALDGGATVIGININIREHK